MLPSQFVSAAFEVPERLTTLTASRSSLASLHCRLPLSCGSLRAMTDLPALRTVLHQCPEIVATGWTMLLAEVVANTACSVDQAQVVAPVDEDTTAETDPAASEAASMPAGEPLPLE